MNPWRPIPLLRLLIPFLGGVLYALTCPECQPGPAWLHAGTIALAGLFLCAQLIKLQHRLHWLQGGIITVSMASLGLLTVQSNSTLTAHCRLPTADRPLPTTDCQLPTAHCRLPTAHCRLYEILEPPRHSSRSVRLIVKGYTSDSSASSLTGGERVLLFLERDSAAIDLQYGDWILAVADLKKIAENKWSYGFNPAQYYGTKGVYSQGWVDSGSWKQIGLPARNIIRTWAFILRDRMLGILKSNAVTGDKFAVASAILLGYTGEITQELRKGFAASGAMHILAVSGMHVGIIFLFLDTMMAFLTRTRYGIMVKSVVILLMIWGYAMVTGLSPPVFRAALMLSLILGGRMFKRKPDSLNVVGASMLVVLVMDPSLLHHLGFQFSYLAVFGILILYKPIFQLVHSGSWVISKLWGLAAVSIAAQLATFPIALYTFHQFPNYFLLTNLLVLPLASMVIYSGIGVLALSPLPILSALLAKLLMLIVGLLNTSIRFIEAIPGSITPGLYPSLPDVLMLYAAIISLCCFFLLRRSVWVFLFLTALILLSSSACYHDIRRLNQHKVVVFQVKGASQYLVVSGGDALCLKDYKAACASVYAGEVLSVFTQAEGISAIQTSYLYPNRSSDIDSAPGSGPIFRKGNFLQISDLRMVVLSQDLPSALEDTIHADLVILRKNPNVDVGRLVNLFHPEEIVIDPTNSWYNARKWKKEAGPLGVSCYSVMEAGVYSLEMERSGP